LTAAPPTATQFTFSPLNNCLPNSRPAPMPPPTNTPTPAAAKLNNFPSGSFATMGLFAE
jgi:hypothetical protein